VVILGIVLLVVGAALLVAEAHLPSYGAVGAAGVLALVAGAALAVDASGGGVALVVAVAATIGLATAALLAVSVRATLAVSQRRARSAGWAPCAVRPRRSGR
jgi:membrane-bound serine protease (ClpP class)